MSLRGYFIAGTDTGVGKTRVTLGLLAALRASGVPAFGMKAVASGTDAAGRNEDVELIRSANAGAAEGDNPYCFEWPISPHLAARRAGISIDPARVVAAAHRLAARDALILVEGTGGWLAPIGPAHTMADIAEALGLAVVLVVGLRLGCLNHALLSAHAITAGRLRLAGWIGSQIESDMLALADNVATLDERLPAPRLALLPHRVSRLDDIAELTGAARALRQGAEISL